MAEVGESPPLRTRSTFGPVVLLGLASAGGAALAANRTTVGVTSGPAADTSALALDGSQPLTTALSLVVLAAWGVLLVTRGRIRRALAWLVLLASIAVVASVVSSFLSLPDDLRSQLRASGITDAAVRPTVWCWLALLAGVLSVAAGLLALRLVAGWPEMGTRYDAPGRPSEAEPESNLDLWKAFDEGRDPTA
ncbi:conserved membrane hypothetical protein [metagenome]|uniref:Trp biosynthesis associated, transmembrane protein, Oprn/Chp n=1 Tax=metagenome TaxID=256318 RepID=A0A2P2BWC1_9ZZZZ